MQSNEQMQSKQRYQPIKIRENERATLSDENGKNPPEKSQTNERDLGGSCASKKEGGRVELDGEVKWAE